MNKTITRIGPADHGRPMDLDEFVDAEGQAGRVYELSRGIVTVDHWIVDADIRAMTVLRRSRSRWIETKVVAPSIHRTRLLPGLAFSIESVFKSAGLA